MRSDKSAIDRRRFLGLVSGTLAAPKALIVAGKEGDLRVDADYPGGNIVVDKIEGNRISVHQDLRHTRGWWFYWNFRVRGAAGRRVEVRFTNRNVIGLCGPAVSADAGRNWSWLGAEADGRAERTDNGASFAYRVPADADEVRFCFAIPYQEVDLERFLKRHEANPHLQVQKHCETRKGRKVRRLHLGKVDGEPKHRIALTCRHHACEMMNSWCLEGILEEILADSEDGRWFRENVEVAAVPFMDKDGVEEGDQGKNRKPHDHNRDYIEDPIYPSVRALTEFLPEWSARKLRITLDMHCPYIRDRRIFFTMKGGGPLEQNTRRFIGLLEKHQRGPLRFSAKHSKVWPPSWGDQSKTNQGWCATLPGIEVATGMELPYARNGNQPITPERARALGRDLVRAMRVYLETGC